MFNFNTKKNRDLIVAIGAPIVLAVLFFLWGNTQSYMFIIYDFFSFSIAQLYSNKILFLILLVLSLILMFVYKKIKVTILVFFIILLAIGSYHIFYYQKFHDDYIETSTFFGVFSNLNENLRKTSADNELNEDIIQTLANQNNDNTLFPNRYFDLPNFFSSYEGKRKILDYVRSFTEKDKSLRSYIILYDNSRYTFYSFYNQDAFNAYSFLQEYTTFLDQIFSDLINNENTNKNEIIKDYLRYQKALLDYGTTSAILLNDKKKFVLVYDILNQSNFTMINILEKYKEQTSNINLKNNIAKMILEQKAGSHYLLASLKLISDDIDGALLSMLDSLELCPYYPLNNLDEFSRVYEAIYHVQFTKSSDKVNHTLLDDNVTTPNDMEGVVTTIYTDNLYKKQQSLKLLIQKLEAAIVLNSDNIKPETYKYIEDKLRRLYDSKEHSIYKFYYAILIKYIPKGTRKFNSIYVDRIEESRKALFDFLKESEKMKNLVYIKISSTYLLESVTNQSSDTNTTENIHKAFDWLMKAGRTRIMYGPTP
jgi:hypothetical protein